MLIRPVSGEFRIIGMPLSLQPIATISEIIRSNESQDHNIHKVERIASVVLGGLALVKAVNAKPLQALILGSLGASLFRRGYTGHSSIYEKLHVDTRAAKDQSQTV